MAELYVFGDLTDELSNQTVRDIRAARGKPLDIYWNCPGGSVSGGLAIQAAVTEHGNVTSHILGICGSAATFGMIASKRRRVQLCLCTTRRCGAKGMPRRLSAVPACFARQTPPSSHSTSDELDNRNR